MTYRKLAWLRRVQSDGPVYSKVHLFPADQHIALCGRSARKQLQEGKVIAQPGRDLNLPVCQRCLKASRIAETAVESDAVIEFDGNGSGG
jgi:hypothetical protein